MDIQIIRPKEKSAFSKDQIADSLHTHLEEFGDPREDIMRCLDYALSTEPNKGGYIVVGHEGDEIAGIVVINKTAMKGYIPGNILVYIAVNQKFRGQGLGKKLMKRTFEEADGDVALHVEPDNPAKYLYEKVGMTNKYLEYRYQKD